MFSEFDRLAMTRALALAERGLETTHPNPRVGCVITKGDKIIGEGWHERAGEAHAEVVALRSAKESVAGATAYVTLEPCSHQGRTPPCVNALIEARIARVVFAVQDPNPRVSGQGADALLRAGITVEAGLMEAEARELNIGFMKRMKDGLPWVRVKLAMSLDGRTALANGASQWITSEHARNDVQRWRARCSAVMTGVGTVIADDPLLNVRASGFKGRQPLRVILDSRLQSPPGAKMFVGLGAAGAGAAGAGAAIGGDVLIFTALGGGNPTSNAARSSAAVGTTTLSDDIAELVNAFESSPNSVSARSADVSGLASTKSDAPPAVVGASSANASGAAKGAAAGVRGAGGSATAGAGVGAAGSGTPAVPGATAAVGAAAGVAAPTGAAAPGNAPASAAVPAGAVASASAVAAVPSGAVASASAVAVVPSGAVAGAGADAAAPGTATATAPTGIGGASSTDDATWAGAALSGAVAVPAALKDNVPTAGTPKAAAEGANNASAPSAAGANSPAPTGAVASSTAPTAPPIPAPAGAAPGATASPIAAAIPGAAATPTASASAPTPSAAAPAPAPRPPVKSDSPAAFQARGAALLARGVRIEEVPADEGFLDMFAVLQKLAELEVNEVLVEAGPTLAGQLLTTFFVDELLLYIAPKLLGPQGRPLVNLPELQSLQDAWGFALFDAKRFGDDLRLRLRPK